MPDIWWSGSCGGIPAGGEVCQIVPRGLWIVWEKAEPADERGQVVHWDIRTREAPVRWFLGILSPN